MDIQRQCVWCGKTYLAHGFGSRYCSTSCKNKAKRAKEKEEKSQFEAVASKLPEVRNPSEKEFLTAKDVAYMFGISTATVYRYAAKGVFKALKLNGVKLVVRKSDLDYLFDHAAPYKKRTYGRRGDKEYYTMREIMEKFNISKKAANNRIKRYNIEKVLDGRLAYFPKKAVDEHFSELVQTIRLDDYYTPEQMMEKFQMERHQVLAFVYWHKVPRKTILRKVYYLKSEVDKLKNPIKGDGASWYTYQQLMEGYGLTKDQISYRTHTYHLKTIKMGKLTLINKKEFDAMMASMSPEKAVATDTPEGATIKELKERREKERQARFQARIPKGYISIAQIADRYKLSKMHVRRVTCQLDIKERMWIGNFCYFPEDIIAKHFAKYEPDKNVKQWISAKQMEEEYMMTKDARHAFSYRHKIPTKWVHGKVYYSKTDIDKVKEGNFEGRENYFSVEDIARNYNLTRCQIYNKIRYYRPRAVRKPPYSYYLIEDIERIFGQIGGENADKDR